MPETKAKYMTKNYNGDTPQIVWTINVDVPGFSNVAVVYNLLASRQQLIDLRRDWSEENAAPVIVEVQNWPPAYGDSPFDKAAPGLVTNWICSQGPMLAITSWRNDPKD